MDMGAPKSSNSERDGGVPRWRNHSKGCCGPLGDGGGESSGRANGVPDQPANFTPLQTSGYTLKVSSRLVDVSIVAYDKKGHPIKDLKQEEIEVYDNGRKQELRFFSQMADQAPAAQAAAPAPERTFGSKPLSCRVMASTSDGSAPSGERGASGTRAARQASSPWVKVVSMPLPE